MTGPLRLAAAVAVVGAAVAASLGGGGPACGGDLLSAASLVGDNGNQASSTKDTNGSVPLTQTDPKPVTESTNRKSDLNSNKIERPDKEMKETETSPVYTAVSAKADNTSSKEGGSSADVKMTEEVSAENDHDTAMENNEIIEKV